MTGKQIGVEKGEKMLIRVSKGEDPYSVIGSYIRDHIKCIEDMIAVIEINGAITNELFMVDMDEDNYFVWKSDWYEGEDNVGLVDFFPVSEVESPSRAVLTAFRQDLSKVYNMPDMPDEAKEIIGNLMLALDE